MGIRMIADRLKRRHAMTISRQLIERALEGAKGQYVEDVRIGLGYTAVLLDGGGCGVAYTFRNALGKRCGVLPDAGSLIGRGGDEIIEWADDSDLLRAAVGLATINAVLNVDPSAWGKGNVTDAIELQPSETFGMVGEFAPVLSHVKKLTDNVHVFEKNVPEGSGLRSESDIPVFLPQCDVVVITATSIINHTIDGILPHCAGARQVFIVGPSTPLCPSVFSGYGVTALAGGVVTDPKRLLGIVSQAGGTPAMKPAVEYVLASVG
jgi:uncharacterized protein